MSADGQVIELSTDAKIICDALVECVRFMRESDWWRAGTRFGYANARFSRMRVGSIEEHRANQLLMAIAQARGIHEAWFEMDRIAARELDELSARRASRSCG